MHCYGMVPMLIVPHRICKLPTTARESQDHWSAEPIAKIYFVKPWKWVQNENPDEEVQDIFICKPATYLGGNLGCTPTNTNVKCTRLPLATRSQDGWRSGSANRQQHTGT